MEKIWIIYAGFAMLFWGVWAFFAKIASSHLSSWSLYVFTGVSTALIVLTVMLIPQLRPKGDVIGILLAVGAGLIGTLALVFFYLALKQGPASIITPLTAIYPAITLILALLFLKEKLSVSQFIGVLLALAGAFLLSR